MTYVIHISKKEHDVGFTLQSEIQFIPWYVLLRSSDCNKLRSLHLMSSFITLIYHSLSTSTFIQNWSLLQQNTPNKSKPSKTHTHVIDSTSNLRLGTALFWFTSKGLRNMGSAMCGGKPKVPSPRPPSADKPLGKHTQTEMPRLKNGGYRCERPCYSLKYNEYIGTSTCVFFMEYLENSIVFTSIYNWG